MTEWNGVQLAGLELRSARLVLRPWQAADAAAVAEILREPRMAEYLRDPQTAEYPREPQTAESLPARCPHTAADLVRAAAGNTGRLERAILRDGRLVGAIGMDLPVRDTDAEIDYWVRSADWGSGYATEAVRTLVRFAFEHGVHRARIQVDVGNPGAARVALRAGFTFEGIARLSGRSQQGLTDHAVFARLATDSDAQVPPSWPELTDLTDGVLLLRKPQPDDWPTLYAEGSNAESQRWGFGGEYTEQTARYRARAAGLHWLVGSSVDLIICDVATGIGAGTMNLRWVGPPDVVGVGYGILPEFRGRRFTTRALRLLADWAFGSTSIVRLELGCKVDNVASARSAELAGFVRDGRFAARLRNPDGSYSDEIGFGLVRDQRR